MVSVYYDVMLFKQAIRLDIPIQFKLEFSSDSQQVFFHLRCRYHVAAPSIVVAVAIAIAYTVDCAVTIAYAICPDYLVDVP